MNQVQFQLHLDASVLLSHVGTICGLSSCAAGIAGHKLPRAGVTGDLVTQNEARKLLVHLFNDYLYILTQPVNTIPHQEGLHAYDSDFLRICTESNQTTFAVSPHYITSPIVKALVHQLTRLVGKERLAVAFFGRNYHHDTDGKEEVYTLPTNTLALCGGIISLQSHF